MTFSVRGATLEDLETLVSFTLAEAWEAEGIEGSAERVRDGVKTGLKDPAVAAYWVLEGRDEGIVGSISAVTEWSDWNAGYYWWIQSLFIEPQFRGRDLMTLLIDAVREQARREKALALRLYVHQDNERAIRAYQRQGFTEAPYQIMVMKV